MLEQAAAFYRRSEDYLHFLAGTEIDRETIQELMRLLMKLYLAGLDLPDCECDADDERCGDADATVSVRIDKAIPDCYWEVYDPRVEEKPVCGSLTDDLSDIARDLRRGMRAYDAGNIGSAVFEWKLMLDCHWGDHALGALRALHALRTR